MILQLSFGLLILVVVIFFLLRFFETNYSLFINPIKGLMIGGLYDSEEYHEEELVQHTVQILIFFVSFMFIWETTLTNTHNE